MRLTALIATGFLALAVQPAAAQTQTYITNFAKTSNIYTALNQQYPNTGPGVPGERTGTPNATFFFTPQETGAGNPNNLNYTSTGTTISYLLASDATGRDFAEVGSADFGVSSLTIPINVANATAFYLLGGAYNGSSFNITFTGSGGYSRSFSNIALPDFNGGQINSVSGDVSDQTVFRVYGVGGGGTGNSSNGSVNFYSMTEVGFNLADLAGRTLTNATITGNGFETLIFGATAVSTTQQVAAAVPEPANWAMLMLGIGVIGSALRSRRRPAGILALA